MKLKKFISIIMIFVFVISVFTVPSSAMTKKKKAKTIKVKKATYEMYKKAYKENTTLQGQLKAKESTNAALKKQLNDKDKQIAQLKDQLAKKTEECEAEKSRNSWVWNNIYSLGISYSSKTWYVPEEINTKWIIDGVTYHAEWK